MQKMYEGKAFSPPTSLTRDIGAADTIVYVEDESVFPAPPGYATIGTDESGETIEYAALAPGVLSGCVRGVEGTARNWLAGESISRCWNNADYEALRGNITELEEKKLDRTGEGREVTVSFDEAESGEPIRTGESLGTLFGKMKQWLGALGSAAWKDTGTSPGTVAEGDHAHQSYDGHLADGDIHVTIDEKEGWNSKSATVAVGPAEPADPNTVVWYNTSAAAQTYVPMTCAANPVSGNLLMTDSRGQAQDSGVPCELVRGYSNAHLDDNWDFANPINQRGQTSYTGAGYSIDRWRNSMPGITTTLQHGGVTISLASAGEAVWCFYQDIEATPGMTGKTYTFSMEVSSCLDSEFKIFLSGRAADGTHINSLSLPITKSGVSTVSLTIPFDAKRIRCGIIPTDGVAAGATISLLRSKLEIGNRSTLHLDLSPDYGQELAKCQRYQYVTNPDGKTYALLGMGHATTVDTAYVWMHLPVPLRANPTIIYKDLNNFVVRGSGSGRPGVITGLAVDSASAGAIVMLRLTSEGKFVAGESFDFYALNAEAPVLDANL